VLKPIDYTDIRLDFFSRQIKVSNKHCIIYICTVTWYYIFCELPNLSGQLLCVSREASYLGEIGVDDVSADYSVLHQFALTRY